jgi:hypothetical protein
MSFEYIPKKPSLVDRNVLKYVNDKTKQKHLAEKEVKQNEENKMKEVENNNKPWTEKVQTYIWNFMKENYGFVILVILIILLLIVRYIECVRKKQKIKEMVDSYSSEKEKMKKHKKQKDQIKL